MIHYDNLLIKDWDLLEDRHGVGVWGCHKQCQANERLGYLCRQL